ncbi:MAG: thioredoxin domain-containing protein [Steroidobacteraceae bacterium]
MSANVVDVNSENWDTEVVQSTLPVLVDFWAPWCGPCIALTPTIEALAAEYAGQLKVVKVNCDDNKAISDRFGVRGIPHLVLLTGGETTAVVAGRTRTRIAAEVETHLA